MNLEAKDSLPSPQTLLGEIWQVKMLLERRIAEQMVAVWRRGQGRADQPATTPGSNEAAQWEAQRGDGGSQPA